MGNVTVEKIDKNRVRLKIEVEAEKFEEAMQKSYLKNVKKYSVPGFRKGKVPRKVLERYYGEGIFYEDAFNDVGAEAYDKAIEENNIFAVDRPEIDIIQIGSGKDLIFTAEVTVKPEVQIEKYKGIEIKKVDYKVTEKDIDEYLEQLREKNARLISIEDRELKKGDIATIDFEGFMDGTPIEGFKRENYELEIGSRVFVEGFEDQLIGMRVNEQREINITFPEDYHSKNLAGKNVVFKVLLRGIKVKELPELDDEFAKDISEFDTLDELKKDIRSRLEKLNNQKAKRKMEEELIEKILENAVVEIPQVMIDRQIDNMIRDFERNYLVFQRMTLDDYLKYTNKDYDQFRKEFSKEAEKLVKTQLVLEKIGEKENIEVTDEDLDNKIADLAKEYSRDVEELKKDLKESYLGYLKEEIKIDKTIKLLMDNAKLVD